MRTFNEIESITERDEIILLFSNWLKKYTHEVIVKVLEKRDEIINNEFTMNLLKELKTREEKEKADFDNSIANLLYDFDGYKEYNPHNNPLTHANSYRDILYDMYIK